MRKIVTLIVLFIYGSMNGQPIFEQYFANSIKFTKQEIKEAKGNYFIYAHSNWEFLDNFTDSDILFWHSVFKEKNNKIIAEMEIIKIVEDKDLKTIYNSYLNAQISDKIIITTGESNLLKYPSFFIHRVSATHKETNNNDEESVQFLLESKQKGIYYLLRVSVTGERQKTNMSIMLQCLKTFTILK